MLGIRMATGYRRTNEPWIGALRLPSLLHRRNADFCDPVLRTVPSSSVFQHATRSSLMSVDFTSTFRCAAFSPYDPFSLLVSLIFWFVVFYSLSVFYFSYQCTDTDANSPNLLVFIQRCRTMSICNYSFSHSPRRRAQAATIVLGAVAHRRTTRRAAQLSVVARVTWLHHVQMSGLV